MALAGTGNWRWQAVKLFSAHFRLDSLEATHSYRAGPYHPTHAAEATSARQMESDVTLDMPKDKPRLFIWYARSRDYSHAMQVTLP